MRSPAGLQCCLFRVGQRASPAPSGTIHKYTINSVHTVPLSDCPAYNAVRNTQFAAR